MPTSAEAPDLPKCVICGATPVLHVDSTVAPPDQSWALACPNTDCNNDTHWQNSFEEVERLWLTAQPCRNMRGGQGEPAIIH